MSSKIQPELDAILEADYGSEVRSAICTALEKMDVDSDVTIAAANSAASAKTAAQLAKSQAETAATNAASSASNAASSKTAAQTAQTAAETAATNANNSKTAAANSATSAASSATSASDSASTATTAKNDAVSAKTAAESAKTAAQTAATNAASSASSATASLVSITEMVQSVEDWYTALFYASKNHRNILRGKSLGTEITAAQWAAIDSGDFTDMYIGDYWVLDGHKYYIADIDYWIDRRVSSSSSLSNNGLTQHHLVMIPELIFDAIQMNNTESVGTGYGNIPGFTRVHLNTVSFLENIFGSHLLPVRYMINNVDSETGIPASGSTVTSRKAELLSEQMVFGHPINSIQNSGTNGFSVRTQIHQQLAIFLLNPQFIFEILSSKSGSSSTFYVWLRDISSSTTFAAIDSSGLASNRSAHYNAEILPSFVIGTPEEEEST